MNRTYVVSCCCVCLLAGCAATPPAELYTLVPPDTGTAGAAPSSLVTLVVVPEARGQGVLAGAALVERRGRRLVPDAYRSWSPRPGLMLAGALADAINRNGTATALADSSADARWTLGTTIRDWSYSMTPSGAVATISVDVEVLDTNARRLATAFRATRHARAAAHTFDALAAAFQEALDGVARACADEMSRHLQTQAP